MSLKVDGDLNINIVVVDEDPELAFDDFDDDPADRIVMMLQAGKEPKVLTYAEACELMPDFMEICVPVDFGSGGLTLYYPDERVIKLGKDVFLFGQAFICSEDEEGDLWSLSGGDIYEIFQYSEENAVTLCDGKNLIPAIRL